MLPLQGEHFAGQVVFSVTTPVGGVAARLPAYDPLNSILIASKNWPADTMTLHPFCLTNIATMALDSFLIERHTQLLWQFTNGS